MRWLNNVWTVFSLLPQCLEEAGIKPRRIAGTSAGAITAGLLAVGYTSEEIHILYEYDVEYNVKGTTTATCTTTATLVKSQLVN